LFRQQRHIAGRNDKVRHPQREGCPRCPLAPAAAVMACCASPQVHVAARCVYARESERTRLRAVSGVYVTWRYQTSGKVHFPRTRIMRCRSQQKRQDSVRFSGYMRVHATCFARASTNEACAEKAARGVQAQASMRAYVPRARCAVRSSAVAIAAQQRCSPAVVLLCLR